MGAETGKTAPLSENGGVRRANRRLNGMGTKAGVPDPPARGRFTRTLALLNAALRVWEANHSRRPISSPWQRRTPRDACGAEIESG
jgi:hypothetical protein